jgi:hypothetical protein
MLQNPVDKHLGLHSKPTLAVLKPTITISLLTFKQSTGLLIEYRLERVKLEFF